MGSLRKRWLEEMNRAALNDQVDFINRHQQREMKATPIHIFDLAQQNPTVRAHLDAWQLGGFDWETMLILLVVELARQARVRETTEQLSSMFRKPAPPDPTAISAEQLASMLDPNTKEAEPTIVRSN